MTGFLQDTRESDVADLIAVQAEEHWPHYAEDEIEAVADALRSGRVNQWTGSDVFAFEEAMIQRFDGGHGVALANGSLALELALKAFGIGPGDEVVVTPRSFAASAFCVMLQGATPVFADVDPDSGNLTPTSIEAVITERTRAVIPVHLAGWPCDMPGIMALAARSDLIVIEDCAQAHGATIGGRSIGSFGHAAAWSFCQDKIISTGGEGGFVSFRDEDRWRWAWSYKDHGKNRAKVFAPPARHGFRWVHDNVGTNWRLTGPQAAIGCKQLAKLTGWVEARRRHAGLWSEALTPVSGLRVPQPEAGEGHAYYKFYAYLTGPEQEAERLRDEILRRAELVGLRVFSGSCSEIYLEHAFDGMPRPDLPNARALGKSSLMVEVHPTLDPLRLAQRANALATIAEDVLS